jgi:DNA-binding LacI/PurR family transcriptional regulator
MPVKSRKIPRRKLVRVADIARRLDLSPMTVSRALRGHGAVHAETQARVVQAAKDLGFQGAAAGAPLGAPKIVFHMTESMLLEDPLLQFWSRLYFLFKKRMEQAGRPCEQIDLASPAAPGRLDGCAVLVAFNFLGPEAAAMLARLPRSLPVIGVLNQTLATRIGADENGAGDLLAAHLHAGGHRHVAVFGPRIDGLPQERHEALARSLLRLDAGARIDFIPSRYPLLPRLEQVREMEGALAAYFRGAKDYPTALYGTDAHATTVAYRWLKGRGVELPAQLGMAGFDDFPVYEHLEIQIARAFFQPVELVEAVCEMVDTVLARAGARPRLVQVPVSFIPGTSLLPVSRMRPLSPARFKQETRP